MAHWAQIDENNKVIQVSVGSNDDPDEGYQWLMDNIGGRWIQTSYNTHAGIHATGGTPLRKNFAGVGYTYDEIKDAFIPPKPEVFTTPAGKTIDWELNEDTCLWELKIVK